MKNSEENYFYSKYLEKIRENLLKCYSEELGLSNIEERIKKRVNRERGKYYISRLAKLVDLKNKKLLDVGSGWGEYLVEAHKEGATVYGLEPDDELLEITDLLLKSEKISEDIIVKKRYAEKIPFEDDFFDVVICCHVLEHVNDIKKSIREMIRVLKKGGYLYLCVPNYAYPFEGHYKIFWLPFMPKWLARVYLRLRGRNPGFINHINYVSSYWLFRELRKYKVWIGNLDEKKKNHFFVKRLIISVFKKIGLYPPSIRLLIKKE